jgi:hypothetical protein
MSFRNTNTLQGELYPISRQGRLHARGIHVLTVLQITRTCLRVENPDHACSTTKVLQNRSTTAYRRL